MWFLVIDRKYLLPFFVKEDNLPKWSLGRSGGKCACPVRLLGGAGGGNAEVGKVVRGASAAQRATRATRRGIRPHCRPMRGSTPEYRKWSRKE